MNKRLEFVMKKFSVKSEKDLTESQLIEYAKSQEAGPITNISINDVFTAIKEYKKFPYWSPDMKRVYKCLREAIRTDREFGFGLNHFENSDRWWYVLR